MSWGKKLREKRYLGKNVTGKKVTGRNVSGENGVPPQFLMNMIYLGNMKKLMALIISTQIQEKITFISKTIQSILKGNQAHI